ncbi:MAG TPA: leucyl aminopeptidase [Candidatus Udaeobacter sp.]|nr:leucyl aminopeptidase [Candidatus Udaeobacter sp.]
MQIEVKSADPRTVATAALVVGVLEESTRQPPWTVAINRALGGAVAERIAAGDLRGKLGEVAVVAGKSRALKAEKVVAVGLGKPALLDQERLRRATGRVVRWLDDGRAREAVLLHHLVADRRPNAENVRAAAEAAVLASFRSPAFGEKGKGSGGSLAKLALLDPESVRIAPSLAQAARAGQVVAESANLARRLAELPGNYLPPRLLAAAAQAVQKETQLQVTVYEEDWIRKRKMGALIGVAQGSAEPPRFIVIEHQPSRRAGSSAKGKRRRPHVALVGKGVTFDTGGISLKPREDMERMKYDMSGAAAVLGALRAASLLDLPLRVTGIIPTVENMPSGTAVKPGDVLLSMAGKSIEVVNTDAEGRLILADALAYAAELAPDAIVDIATLTGACRIALGGAACGLMGNDPDLVEELQLAGDRSGEAAWPLPLYNEYADDITSEVADLKNSGGRSAGALTAGTFLRAFVGEHPWAHLDIAGPAWVDKDRDYLKCGSAGFGVRLFTRFLEARA